MPIIIVSRSTTSSTSDVALQHQEFEKLGEQLDDRELQRMRHAVKVVESIAPARSHAGVESTPANMIAGPFAAMLDRAHDAISGPG